MSVALTGGINVLAQLQTPAGSAQVVEYHFTRPASGRLRGDGKFRVELSLSARHRSARACFQEQWKRNRFERVGDLFVLHPHADFIAKSDESSNITAIVCELDAQPMMEMFDTVPEPTDQLLMASLDVRNERARNLLMWIAEEARRPSFASQTLAEMMCAHLTIELFRHGAAIAETERCSGLASWRLRLIEQRLKDMAPAPSVSELAELCRLSLRQLSRGFRASRDCSISAYIAQRQIDQAKQLLSTGVSVAAIAQTLGFASSSSFCFAFRRETGVTPNEYRQRLL